jgi:hypothetical protein
MHKSNVPTRENPFGTRHYQNHTKNKLKTIDAARAEEIY